MTISPDGPSPRRDERRREPIRLGLLGCGTVGGGVLRLLAENAGALSFYVSAPLEVRRIAVRDVDKPRVAECDRSLLTTSVEAVVDDPEIDIVVEVMGGEEPAAGLIARAIANGKSVVCANKMVLATKRGEELVDLALERGVDLAFEGAVGGGIPIVRTLRQSFASDRVERFVAIINGTCNYVLTRMQKDGKDLDEAVREAQAEGYAEADPTLDIGGHDAAHKLSILAMLAFGARTTAGRFHVEGITAIDAIDHRFAARFGYVIKHLAIGRRRGEALELRVHPALVANHHVLANVSGVFNAVLLEGRALGPCLVYGRGAGDLPTAVSVVADTIDVARAIVAGVPGLEMRTIQRAEREVLPMKATVARYYLRFSVEDRPRVMGRLTSALGDEGASIEQIVQEPSAAGGPASVVIVTRHVEEAAIGRALGVLGKEPFMAAPPRLIRIEDP